MELSDALTQIKAGNASMQVMRAVAQALLRHPGCLEGMAEAVRRETIHGRSPEEDDREEPGALLAGAIALLEHAHLLRTRGTAIAAVVPSRWPWPAGWKQPITAEDALVRAVGLLGAEMDKIARERVRESAAARRNS